MMDKAVYTLKVSVGILVTAVVLLTFSKLFVYVYNYANEPSVKEKACTELDPKFGHFYTPKHGPYRGIIMSTADLGYYYEEYYKVSLYFVDAQGNKIGKSYYCNEIVEVRK